MATARLCSIEGCGKRVLARGWCAMHYSRWRSTGDPLEVKGTPKGEPKRFLQDVVLPYRGDDCLVWPFQRNSHGYGFIFWDGRDVPVSRVVCEEVNGPPPTPKHHAAHGCGKGNEGCCTPAHMRWATATENAADKFLHGTDNAGERCYNSKLTADDVRTIRALRGTMSFAKIGARYGVSRGTISDIYQGRTWGSV